MISLSMVEAIKVMFAKPIFEDDFVEKGMTAWLTDIEYDKSKNLYRLYFDFTEFEDINKKYFKKSFYQNENLVTAWEAGLYYPKYSVYFSFNTDEFPSFEDAINTYLIEIRS